MQADFTLYEALAAGVSDADAVTETACGKQWNMAAWAGGMGLAMNTPGDSIPAAHPEGIVGLPLREAAKCAASWNLTEAGYGLAAANSFYNTPARMDAMGTYLSFDIYATVGIDLRGMTVGIVGHMHGPKGLRDAAKAVYVIERTPQPGDYPDAACDLLLPQCDLVLITGSSLVNKTLPHLLTLCRNAVTILTGPSVPMCPALLDYGIDRLAGLVVTDPDEMRAHVRESRPGHPYYCGKSFLLKR